MLRRNLIPIAVAIALVFSYVVFFISEHGIPNSTSLQPWKKQSNDNIMGFPNSTDPVLGSTISLVPPSKSHYFWYQVFDVFDNNRFVPNKDWKSFLKVIILKRPTQWGRHDKKGLLEHQDLPLEHKEQLTKLHANVLSQLPENLGAGTYVPGTKGIVFVGGGMFSYLAYLAIVQLRDNGSELPVEVALPTLEDYKNEYEFCEKNLLAVGAKCVVIEDKFGTAVSRKWKFSGYQYKVAAILSSTFEKVFLFDADVMTLANPDYLFESDVFKDHGLLLWPDFWFRPHSPDFYEVAKLQVNEKLRVRYKQFPLMHSVEVDENDKINFHDKEGAISDYSTESGELIVDKKSHGKMMLMTLYYNLLGPDIYFDFFSLGSSGTGDKDTFSIAATVTNSSYYQLKSLPYQMRFINDKQESKKIAHLLKEPVQDYKLFRSEMERLSEIDSKGEYSMEEQIEMLAETEKKYFSHESEIPNFCIHCNFYKFNPFTKDGHVQDKHERLLYREYNNLTYTIEDEEIDFELKRWSIVKQALCDDKIQFYAIHDKDVDNACHYVQSTIDWLNNEGAIKPI
ncbi:hypothetical protein G9P44_005517 [Scheffersomyces stipitis]|nr:hypothetical protein G9P44_005517 [Scheffersomyces stipitis]